MPRSEVEARQQCARWKDAPEFERRTSELPALRTLDSRSLADDGHDHGAETLARSIGPPRPP